MRYALDPTRADSRTADDAVTARILTERMAQTIAEYGRAATLQALADALSLLAQEQEQDQDHTSTPAGLTRWATDTTATCWLRAMAQTYAAAEQEKGEQAQHSR